MSASVIDQHVHPADDSLDFTGQQVLRDVPDAGLPDPVDSGAELNHAPEERHAARGPAPHAASPVQGIADAGAGPLSDVEPDTMTLHTRDAYHMFIGRKHEPGTQHMPIVGGKTFAAVLKSIWYRSAQDNPYADWMLIQLQAGLDELRERLAQATLAREDMMEQLRRKGLTLSVMSSRQPVIVALGFRSPYGYASAETMVEFDYYVRVVKTLVHKDRLSDAQGRNEIRTWTREMRSFFLGAVRLERLLSRDELTALSRSDFLPDAEASARKRTEAAVALFGVVPQKILLGVNTPRHTRRRAKPTEAELRALQQAAQCLNDDADRAGEALL